MNAKTLSTFLLGAVTCMAVVGSFAYETPAFAAPAATPDSKDGYVMKVDKPKSVKAGQESSYTVKLTRKEPWHVNQEFPTKLKVTEQTGVTYPKVKLTKADADKFSESEVVFKVPFKVADKGGKKLESELVFSICIESQCSRVTEKIEVAVNAK